jgi:hypothetical protein
VIGVILIIGVGVFFGWLIGHYSDHTTKTVRAAAARISVTRPTLSN